MLFTSIHNIILPMRPFTLESKPQKSKQLTILMGSFLLRYGT